MREEKMWRRLAGRLLSRSTRTRFKRELEDLLGVEILVPPNSQHAGAVGIATLVSGV